MRKVYVLFYLFFSATISVSGQYSLTVPAYNQNFDNLGTANLTGITGGNLNFVNTSLNGWFFFESGTNANIDITAGNGSSGTGDTYNFGTAAAIDRTLGGLQSGTLIPSYGFYFTNNTGSTITSLAISYNGEQWRLGTAGRVDRLDFQYSLNANTINSGNWVDADVFDFTAPVTTIPLGALDGNLAANRTAISSTIIGLTIPIGSTCFIRWIDFDGIPGADDGLGVDDFSLTANSTPSSTDYFRSSQTGAWNALTTWESSPDAIIWNAATLIPDFNANTITIKNAHTVTINSFPVVDQVTIQSGGTLDFVNGSLTVNGGAGNDIDVESNGAFVLSSPANPPAFTGASPVVNIQSSGILRVSASGLTITPGAGIHLSNFVYQHQSILEYTLSTAFGTVGVTYFPNAGPGTIPVFRITQNIGVFVGSVSNTIINGVFEANGNITFTSSGTKTFRNGIRGTGSISESNSGKFIINGTSAELGGSGSLTVPVTGGLEIGTPTVVTMISNKTITGNVSLLANSTVQLGAFDLTVTGTVSNTSLTSYVKTNGIGKLTLNNVGSGLSAKLFPIGLTTINPLFISSGTTANYSARIVEPITPLIYNDIQSVLRTWYITSSQIAPAATISFGYSFQLPECGVLYNNSGPVEVGVNILNIWNIHQLGLTPVAFPLIPGTFIVTPGMPINYFNSPIIEFPFVIANNGAILPLDYYIVSHAQKINNTGRISWKVLDTDNVSQFEVQRSTDNSSYQTIAVVNPFGQLLEYDFTDAALPKGTNLYRIKVIRLNGAIVFSNTVAVINDSKGLIITSLVPNPVQNRAILTIGTAKAGTIIFTVYNMSGKLIKQWPVAVSEGTNNIPVNVPELVAGIYHIIATSADVKTIFRFVKQ